jgi:hypothetical protein
MAEDWTEIEVELILADYFAMLLKELAGIPYNKTEHRKRLLPLLNNRSEGSIEYKHQNISAALAKVGAIYIKGYKPAWRYQKALLDRKVSESLNMHKALFEPKFEQFTEEPIKIVLPKQFEHFIDDAPERSTFEEPPEPYFKPIKINYLEKEQRNRSLGQSGEELVIAYEKWRLNIEGKHLLADKVEWISRDKGDGAGFDILSKNKNGSDRYIEVKTTKLSKETPIFFSKTEFDFSKKHTTDYWLYRVFNIQKDPKMFQMNGRFDNFCNVEAINFKGSF